MPQRDKSNDTVSLPEVAQLLGVRWDVAYRLVLTGELHGWLEGGRWRVDVASIERVRRQRTASAPAAT